MNEGKITLTPDEAISLLPDGEYIHNYANPTGGIFIGCDYDRTDAEAHIRKALSLEIGGPYCKSMKHALVVWENEKRCTFFATDMAKVEAAEAEKSK